MPEATPAAPREVRVRLAASVPLTADIRLIRVKAIEPAAFGPMPAGAWMQWRIPAPDGTILRRCFSIASGPADSDSMEFIIRRNPEGLGTQWIFEKAAIGDEVTLFGPNGRFRLQDNDEPAVMVAGGSGLSAIRSLLFALRDSGRRKPVTLFFGATCRAQLYLLDELEAFTRSIPRLRFIPALSRPEPDDAWDGETGRITEVLDRLVPEGVHEAYLCGSPGMLEACVAMLAPHGIPADRVYFDKFIPSKK